MKRSAIKVSKYIIIIIAFILFLFKFFYLMQGSDGVIMTLCGGDKQTGLVILLFLCGVYILFRNGGKIKGDGFYADKLALLVALFWVGECIYSILKYRGQNGATIVLASIYLLTFFLFNVLKFYVNLNQNRYTLIMNLLCCASIAWGALLVGQSVIYAMTHTFFLNSQILQNSEGITYIRNDMLRCGENSTLLAFSFVLSISVILGSSKKEHSIFGSRKIHILNAIVCAVAILLVCQVRVLTAGMLVIVFVSVLCRKYKRSYNKVIVMLFVFLLVLFFLLSNNVIMTKFLSYESSDKSYLSRAGAYPYYLQLIISNPLLGVGVITGEDTASLSILRGPYGQYYTSDCGLIGAIARFGIIPLLIVIAVVYHLIRDYRRYRKKDYKPVVLINMALLVLLYCTTLSCFEVQSIALIPLVLFVEWGYLRFESMENIGQGGMNT